VTSDGGGGELEPLLLFNPLCATQPELVEPETKDIAGDFRN
jgi:hypothetical protein